MKHCVLCPRHCGADRTKKKGACGSGALLRVARAALHYGEEPCISGTSGSGTVFFSGCSLRCVFCQNREISRGNVGEEITIQRLADIFRELEEQGAANINLVTPDHWSLQIRQALERYRPKIPVLFNCSGYETVEMLKSLEGLVDVWLPDLKYSDPQLAERLSGAPDYPEVAFRAVKEMFRQSGSPALDGNGMIRKGVMVRHLVLPLHLKNTFGVLDRILEEFGADTWVSLLFQYTPMGDIRSFPELSRPLTKRERDRAEQYFMGLGFRNGYLQEAESTGILMIPAFDGTGVVSDSMQ
ncbi:MAG: radical SAM protein [Stomatobaculum sp.]|nr:radical SAM protein [Stomatobaculum sp.]